jgi:NADP-dependent 3-hydroxy acid dehydrogenase YdfG
MPKPTCVVVTGAAGNLGRATAARLASEGVNLVCVDRTTEALDALVQSLPPEAKVLTFAVAASAIPAQVPARPAIYPRQVSIQALVWSRISSDN